MAPTPAPSLRLHHLAAAGDPPPAAWAAVREAIGYAAPDEPLPPDTAGVIAYRGEEPVARAGFGVRADSAGVEGATGYVGWYEAAEDEAGIAVLREVVEVLAGRGVTRIVGPLNGSTWHRYRLVQPDEGGDTAGGGHAFLSEPQNPAAYVRQFLAAGFQPRLEYESRLVAAPTGDAEVETVVLPRLRERGIALRDLEVDRLEEELRALHRLSLEAFAANPFYSPIGYEEFAAMYRPLRPLLDPALVRMAVDGDGRLMGYVFAFTDPLAPANRPRIVLKTLAAGRAARGLGLGRALVDDINRTAAGRGHAVIHALMQSSNVSRSISRRSDSLLFRRYTLFEVARR